MDRPVYQKDAKIDAKNDVPLYCFLNLDVFWL